MRGQRDLVAGARVVEARGDVDDESHLPAHGEHPADDPVTVRLAGARRGHEVLHLAHPVGREEAGDQDIGIGEVELLGATPVAIRGDAKPAAAVGVEDAPKTLGESKRGQQYQSMVPSVPTSATVCRSPIRPCSAIGR